MGRHLYFSHSEWCLSAVSRLCTLEDIFCICRSNLHRLYKITDKTLSRQLPTPVTAVYLLNRPCCEPLLRVTSVDLNISENVSTLEAFSLHCEKEANTWLCWNSHSTFALHSQTNLKCKVLFRRKIGISQTTMASISALSTLRWALSYWVTDISENTAVQTQRKQLVLANRVWSQLLVTWENVQYTVQRWYSLTPYTQQSNCDIVVT